MINFKNFKLIATSFLFLLIIACGYQPILNKENQKFTIVKFNLDGNKRIGGLLKNNFLNVKKSPNKLILNIKSQKKTAVVDKSQTGKVLTYKLTLEFDISVNKEDNEIVYSKVYSRSQNYAVSDVHMDTLNNEKKLVESLIESVAGELQIELNSIYQ